MTVVTRQAMTDDSGLFTDGTAVDEAFVDQVYGQIDDQVHSTTNPTIKPKAITDEVVAARGSAASLDARLDVSLEESGALKTQASLVTAAQVRSGLGSRNVAVNGDLLDWTLGGALAPDGFTLTGAAATIARSGIGMADTTHFGTGSGFAAMITRLGTNWKLTQDVVASADFAKFTNVKGQKFSASVKAQTGVVTYLRIVVDDGVTTTASAFHTASGAEEHLSVTHTISNSATKLSVYVEGVGSDGIAYVGGFNFVFSDLAPTDWSPLSVIGDASATSKGLITTGTQTIAGVKTFSSAPIGAFGYVRNSADDTVNNSTTLVDVTDLAFAVVANGEYAFRFVLKCISNNTANYKFALTGPAAPTGVIYGAQAGGVPVGVSAAAAFATAVFAPSTSVAEFVVIEGYLRNGANAGTVQLQFAQSTAAVVDTKVLAESFCRFERRA